MEPSIKDTKKALREAVMSTRRILRTAYREEASRQMRMFLYELPQYKRAETIFAYASMPEEVQLYGLMEQAIAEGRTVCLPLITGRGTMVAVQLSSMDDLVPGQYGILTVDQAKRHIIPADSIDFMVVPGVAFDREGQRLGLGAGYYDRFMAEQASQAFRCALAFDCQLVTEVPTELHDECVQYIITEKESFAVTKSE